MFIFDFAFTGEIVNLKECNGNDLTPHSKKMILFYNVIIK